MHTQSALRSKMLNAAPYLATFFTIGVLAAAVLWAANVRADGMIPATSVVIVNEADGEAVLKVTNSDSKPSLLHVTLQDIPEDKEPLLLVTPPVSRVEPGKSQQVRFILRTGQAPLKTQRLKRVIVEGITQAAKGQPNHARVGVGVRQNLPVLIHPAGLAQNREPWTGLKWSRTGETLTVANDTPYVVRLSQQVQLLPMNATTQLPRTYVLPGDKLNMKVPAGTAQASGVRLFPATVYGFAVDAYDAPLQSPAAP